MEKQHGKGLLPMNLYCREMLDRRMGLTGADNVRIALPGLYTCTNSTDNNNNHHTTTRNKSTVVYRRILKAAKSKFHK